MRLSNPASGLERLVAWKLREGCLPSAQLVTRLLVKGFLFYPCRRRPSSSDAGEVGSNRVDRRWCAELVSHSAGYLQLFLTSGGTLVLAGGYGWVSKGCFET